MSGRRPRHRFVAWLALVAILLAGIPPAGAHVGLIDRLGDHDDYCSVSGAVPPGPAQPHPAGHDSRACTHCDGCTGTAGSGWAPPATTLGTAIPAACAEAIADSASTQPRTADLIAAPPRGPPHLA